LPRDVVEMDRWAEVAKKRRREIAAAVAAFIKEACCVGDVVLFGSRARGDFHDMSDWDLAVVTQDGEYTVETEEFGQVVYIPLAKLRQIARLLHAHTRRCLRRTPPLWKRRVLARIRQRSYAVRQGEKAGKK
jgi:predicted nucleotidyltransferase